MSLHPELNSKIRLMNPLAPAAYVSHLKSKLFVPLIPHMEAIATFLSYLDHGEIDMNFPIVHKLISGFCEGESVTNALCVDVLFEIAGDNPKELNQTMLPMILGHFPSTLAVKTIAHYGQSRKYGTFSHYRYDDEAENMKRYGTPQPPPYDLSKVKAPVAIWYGENDWLVPPEVSKE